MTGFGLKDVWKSLIASSKNRILGFFMSKANEAEEEKKKKYYYYGKKEKKAKEVKK